MGAVQQVIAAYGAGVVTYPTWNPADKHTTVTLSNSDRTASNAGGNGGVRATIPVPSSSDKYWEFTVTSGASGQIGIAKATVPLTTFPSASTDAVMYLYGGQLVSGGVTLASNASYTTADVIGIRYDSSTGVVTFYKNNTLQPNSVTGLSGIYYPAFGGGTGAGTVNFGPTLTYSLPSGASMLTV